jgi:hypothetical protein
MKPARGIGMIAVGGACGLAWAASLRGWMVQIAGKDSSFSWLGTFALILLPGAVVGALLGWAEYLRRTQRLWGRRQRWLVASPLLLAGALLDPEIFHALITTGAGGGAIGVVMIGLLGGYALARRGPRWSRIVAGLLALIFIIGASQIGAEQAPLSTAHGAWVAVQVVSLLVVLCMACSIPHRTAQSADDAQIPAELRPAAGRPRQPLGPA